MAAGRVAVVGAGLAGLSAGLALRDAGYEVTLFERSRLLGGRATSFHAAGHEVDNGQHVFLGCCTEFIDFVDQVEMSRYLHMQDRFDALVVSRRGVVSRLRAAALPAPWHLVSSFLGYRHLGLRSKLRVARALANAEDARRSNVTFGEWLARSGQSEDALRAFWRPFFVPALNAPLDRMSAADAGFVMTTAFLHDARSARFGYSTVPLARIAAAAAQKLYATLLETPVVGLSVSRQDSIVRGIMLEGGIERVFDAVVLALPPPQLARLLGDPESFGLSPIDGYEAAPIVDVHLWHDRGTLGFDFAALLDSPVQWVFEKAPGYLCASLSAAGDYVTRPTDELVELAWAHVSVAVPGLAGAQRTGGAATRTPQATFMARPGTARPGAATKFSNLAIAGSWTDTGWPDTMESAVISGRAAARVLCSAALQGVRVA